MRQFFSIYTLIIFLFSAQVYADAHHPQEFLKKISGTNNEGEQIYKYYCANCHAQTPLIPLGAPRIGKEEDWTSRLKQGMDVLFNHTNEGMGNMPPRGGCFECTDEQLMLAMKQLFPKKTQKSSFK